MAPGSYSKSGAMGSYFPPKCWSLAASWVPSACRLSEPTLASLLQECASLLQPREALLVPEKMSSRRLSSSCPGAQLPQLAANYPTIPTNYQTIPTNHPTTRPPPLSLLEIGAHSPSSAMNISGKERFPEQKTPVLKTG